MINNYTSKAEEVLIEPSSALSLAVKLRTVGYVRMNDNNTFDIQCLCKEAEDIVEEHLDKKLDWK